MTCTDDRLDEMEFDVPVPLPMDEQEQLDDTLRAFERERLGTLIFDQPIQPYQPLRILEMLEDTIRVEPIEPPDPKQLYQDIVDARQAILDQPNYIQAQRVIDEQRERYADEDRWALRGDGPYQYCWCSPSRGMLFDGQHRLSDFAMHYLEWPEPVTYTRWDPPLPPTPSKELAVIQPSIW